MFFIFKQKPAYELLAWLEFRRVLFRTVPPAARHARTASSAGPCALRFSANPATVRSASHSYASARARRTPPTYRRTSSLRDRKSVVSGKSVDLGGRRIIKKKKENTADL